jgi:PAS domain S-box-containing protein
VNTTACELLGYERDELLALSIFDIDPFGDLEGWNAGWEQLKKYGRLITERYHRARDGRIFPVEVISNCLEFGGQMISCTFARDITGRKWENICRWSCSRLHNRPKISGSSKPCTQTTWQGWHASQSRSGWSIASERSSVQDQITSSGRTSRCSRAERMAARVNWSTALPVGPSNTGGLPVFIASSR